LAKMTSSSAAPPWVWFGSFCQNLGFGSVRSVKMPSTGCTGSGSFTRFRASARIPVGSFGQNDVLCCAALGLVRFVLSKSWVWFGSFCQNGVHRCRQPWVRLAKMASTGGTALGSFGQIAGRWVRGAISVADFCCDRARQRIAGLRISGAIARARSWRSIAAPPANCVRLIFFLFFFSSFSLLFPRLHRLRPNVRVLF
jgi:hypothetical protein